MIANILQNPRSYALPLIATTSWAAMLASAVCNQVLTQQGSTDETALDIAKYAALASASTIGLATIVTLGKSMHAGAKRGASHFWRTLTKSMSPINARAPRCNIGQPDAIFCNTLIASFTGPVLFIFPKFQCWNHPCWNRWFQEPDEEAQPAEAPPAAAVAEPLHEIEGSQPAAAAGLEEEVVLAAGGAEFEEGENGD